MAYYDNRQSYAKPNMFPPLLMTIIGLNVLVYAVEHLVLPGIPGSSRRFGTMDGEVFDLSVIQIYGALWPVGSAFWQPWQYLTHMFLHASPSHLFGNMLMLWIFGMELENMWGAKRFLIFYLICGLAGGIVHSLSFVAGLEGFARAVGASGAVMGVSVGFALLYPDRLIYYFFIPIKVKWLVTLYVVSDLVNGFMGSDGVAHFAHLGGALAGFLIVKAGGVFTLGGIFDRAPKKMRERSEERPAQPPPARKIVDLPSRDISRETILRARVSPAMDFGEDQARVNAILDKVNAVGYQNLTEEEKIFLKEVSKRM